MPTHADNDIFSTFMTLLDKINVQGFQPDLLILDNEASQNSAKY